MSGYWTQWLIQNVLPPSLWTLTGLAAGYLGQRHRAIRLHAEQLALAARLHLERLGQAREHHDEVKRQLAAHCADLRDHITAQAAPGGRM